MLELNKIYNLDCRVGLRQLESDSIDCVVTSPPYWALRDYKTEPLIWGGNEKCEHEWGDGISKPINLQAGNPEFQRPWREEGSNKNSTTGHFCINCGAWRGSLGLEPDFNLYLKHLCDIFDEVKRVLKPTGTCWVVLGDTYGGSGNASGHTNETTNLGYNTSEMGASKGNQKTTKGLEKSLCQIPSRFAIEMSNRGWILRNEIIWYKPNCMPSSVKDRFTVDFEKVFFFVKSRKYYFEQQFEPMAEASAERYKYEFYQTGKLADKNRHPSGRCDAPGMKKFNGKRNKRCVWEIKPQPFAEAHFAVFPESLIEPMIKAGCPKKGIVLDPFIGAGTTAKVAKHMLRDFIGFELNPEYVGKIARKRISQEILYEALEDVT